MGQDSVSTPRLSFGPEQDGADETPETGTPYAQYVRLETLHSLQHPRSKVDAELSFIITTQVMELLFDLLRHEWTTAQHALREDDLTAAFAALRRGTHVQDVLISSWDLLATMTPGEFTSFREVLGEASGFQSSAFLRLEFMLGNKNASLLEMYQGSPAVHGELTVALHAPSLYDEALALLARRGVAVPHEPGTARYRANEEVEAAWRLIYTDPERAELARLGEALLDTAERVTRWRQRHYSSVKRTMGAKPGTGGSSGLTWLKQSADQDVFPELWTVRSEL
ncbi:tryptophan 2,3-dioxygenase family protein [Kitasatospora sp. MAP5-34]|uniref:tryptophan 2,3-dioxygenase n=1 Tax=Kitasatospora sp. MAP5-34 TaxID=3035102 RepID=UPI00247516CE|nr:tryptophan 2,3-dioxygenase family protein [Kitasatospora sp. MAP5-34]MDH6574930.1 tryptophan 2,3-dioxygenase [Kitasatospora sp. MAP5-34]